MCAYVVVCVCVCACWRLCVQFSFYMHGGCTERITGILICKRNWTEMAIFKVKWQRLRRNVATAANVLAQNWLHAGCERERAWERENGTRTATATAAGTGSTESKGCATSSAAANDCQRKWNASGDFLLTVVVVVADEIPVGHRMWQSAVVAK